MESQDESGILPLRPDTAFKSWFAALAIALSASILLWLALPNAADLKWSKVEHSRIVMVEAAFNDQVRRVSAATEATPLSDQRIWPANKTAQFHFTFARLSRQDSSVAVIFPDIAGYARFSVNGIPITDGQEVARPAWGLGTYMLSGTVPPSALAFDINRADLIRFAGSARAGMAGAYLARPSDLEAIDMRLRASRSALTQMGFVAATIALLTGLVGIMLGTHRKSFLGGAICGASLLLNLLGDQVPVSASLPGGGLLMPALFFGGALLCLFGLRQARGIMEVLILGLALLACGVALFVVSTQISKILPQDPLLAAWFVNTGLAALLVFGLPLLLMQDVSRYVNLLRNTRSEMAEQGRILEQKEAALHDQIRQKAVLEERQRFVRDVHDGVGGQLLSLLMRVRSGLIGLNDVEQEIHSGINDLRLVVDSLDHVGGDLEQAMATFYTRVRQQMDAANVAVDWQQSGKLTGIHLDTRHILSIYRIMQEAISNAVRHSGADRLEISIHPEQAGALAISIADNGKGFDPAQARQGKGLRNMQERADQLGARLSVVSNSGGKGTLITILLGNIHKAVTD